MKVSSSYPIIEQRVLAEAPKRGPFGFGGRGRADGDLPRVDAHQVLVFRVDGRFVLDNGYRGLRDEQVVNASHVSLVDMTRNTPVMVELAIPSAEAGEFTVQVQFLCTVQDAETVVRDGHEATIALLGYLRSHHRIFELGLDHPLTAINTVRRDVKAQIEAYTELKPPNIPGMTIAMASVEVLTPGELVELHRTLRGHQHGHTVELTRAAHETERDRVRTENDQALDQMRADYQRLTEEQQMRFEQQRLLYERQRQELEQALDRQRQLSEQGLARQARAFAQEETAEVYASIGTDPLKAALFAHSKGELTTRELQGELEAAKEREQAEQETLRQEAREDVRRAEELDQADRRYALGVRLDVLKEVARHGHLDEIHVDVERLIGRLVDESAGNGRYGVSGGPVPTTVTAAQAPEEVAELPRAASAEFADDVREEDGD
ncbi:MULTISPECIES: hypothetical protein [Thermomonosporaceae]|uniref:hypothetical protein n=1 Tax=Thermomonosporaceae TaxID=2012 RepID=UPI00255AD256|nr:MULTISPECIES: hypothetical protein [Thermomonosporaceae]MDL4772810.1 hypothetical protein [Actinomadura xylanilytica]